MSNFARLAASGQFIRIVDPEAVPLVGVAYVDRATDVPLSEQTGSVNFPFSTIAAAIASLTAGALTIGGVIIASPGDYTSEGVLGLPPGAWTLQSSDPHANYVYGGAGLLRVSIAGLVATSGFPTINFVSVLVAGVITGIGVSADSSWFDGAINGGFVEAFDCRFTPTSSVTVSLGAAFTDCLLQAMVLTTSAAVAVRMVDCELGSSFTCNSAVASTTLRICGRTNFFLQSITQTLTNTIVNVQTSPGTNPFAPTPIVASGALGVVNIASLQSGGCIIFQPSASFNLDGFTAKANGFWFDAIVDSTNQAFVGSVNQDVGATTTSVRNPYNIPYQMVAGSTTRFRWQLNRWRICSPSTPSAQALISVPVPALAAAVLGYVNVSLVGTALAGAPAGSQIVASPQADLAAAGAAAGYYIGCRVSAADTARLAFVGTLAGGNVNFLFTRL